MSPAMLDSCISIDGSPGNPKKGPICPPASASSLDHRTRTPVPSMDPSSIRKGFPRAGNFNEPGLDNFFASPGPSPRFSSTEKASSTPRLSKPRLVKVRRHLASTRVKPAVAAESGTGLDFNPFRSGPSVACGSNRGEDEKMREPRLNVKSFDSVGGVRAAEGSDGSSSGSFDSSKSENVGFVFGGGSNSISKSNEVGKMNSASFSSTSGRIVNLGSFESATSKNNGLVFGASSSSASKHSESGSAKDASSSFVSSGSGNWGSFESLKSESGGNTFVASASGPHDFSTNVDLKDRARGGRKDAPSSFAANGSENSYTATDYNAGESLSGIGLNRCSNLAQNSPAVLDVSTVSKLPDEMQKLNIKSSGNKDGSEKMKKTDNSAFDQKNGFAFGRSKDFVGPFVRNPVNELLEATTKVNSNSGTTSQIRNDRSMDFETSVFIFGSSASKLPDEMGKLNIKSTGKGDGFEKMKGADHTSKVDQKSTFVSGSSRKDAACFRGNPVNELPEEMKKLAIDEENTSHIRKDGTTGLKSSVFVFGSDLQKSSVSDQFTTKGSDRSTCTELPDEMQKLNIGKSGIDGSLEKTKDGDQFSKANQTNAFIFGSNKNACSTFGETGGPFENNKSSSGITNAAIRLDKGFSSSYSSAGNSTPFQFMSESRNQDTNPCVGTVPPANTHDNIRQKQSLNLSSEGSASQPVGTDFTFKSAGDGLGTPQVDFRTLKQDISHSSMENLVSDFCQNLTFSMKKGMSKDARSKKRRGKLTQSAPIQKKVGKDQFLTEICPPGNSEFDSPASYSPMDFSPYQDTSVANQCLSEASVASDESIPYHISAATPRSFSVQSCEEGLVSAAQCLDINPDDLKHGELEKNDYKDHVEANINAKSSSQDEQVTGLGQRYFMEKTKSVGINDCGNVASETATGFSSSNIERQASDGGTGFTFACSSDEISESSFTFSASPYAQCTLSSSKRHYRRKSRAKVDQDSYNSTPIAKAHLASSDAKYFPIAGSSLQQDLVQGLQGAKFVSQSEEKGLKEKKKTAAAQESNSVGSASGVGAVKETCEKWRLRGNQAYANGHLSKAEEYYTHGVNCVSSNDSSRSCMRALMLCYSNRAATRMSLGRMREALSDCFMAVAIDPGFLKAQVRAGNCHVILGEAEDATKRFKKCLQTGNDVILDTKILSEASDGLQKAKQVADYMNRAAELLLKRNSDETKNALEIVSEALSISPLSESLNELKAEALLMLRSYEEVVQLCEQTLDSAEKNIGSVNPDNKIKNVDGFESTQGSPARLWRWRLISKSYFYLGRLEEAIKLLEKHEQVGPVIEKYGNKSLGSSASLSTIIRELLRLKAAGNEAFQAGRHLEAVEHYTAALACNIESRPFSAICFCNRAAAYQALGQMTEAIADCSLAIALDTNYPKAISRRATLHEMIRDYGQAITDLHRLISLLEQQTEDKRSQSGALERSTSSGNDLKRARHRLAIVEEEGKKGIPLEMYRILGVESSSTVADIKKAYRKAALRHHPDKAGQFLARSENGDDGLYREVADEVHRDADRLFKMIGEAYAVLSDTSKRLQYDMEEEMRNISKKGNNGSSSPKTQADFRSSNFEKGGNRRESHGHWKSYGSSYERYYY